MIDLNLNKANPNEAQLPRVGDKVKVRKRANPFPIERVKSFEGVAEATTSRGNIIQIYKNGGKLTADLLTKNGRKDLGAAKVLKRRGREASKSMMNNPGKGLSSDDKMNGLLDNFRGM